LDAGERATVDGEQSGRSLSTGLEGWLATIRASGRSATELADTYRLPEAYIRVALAGAEAPV
ncbi:MAG: precorrin-3B C(17)-methyltransferase, partial [Thauera sp.]